MAGTREGGLKAAKSNIERHGKDFYVVQGKKGGSTPKSTPSGIATDLTCDCELIQGNHFYRRCAGAKGGTISRRGKNAKKS